MCGNTGFADPVHPADWSTYELALFLRAATLLSSQALRVVTEQGRSDEGEPWLVFCDPESGDVFAHFARMQEGYVACVPFRERAQTGLVLAELLARFLRRHGIPWSAVARPAIRSLGRLA